MRIVYVTVGTTNGSIEKEFEIPDGEGATYLGLEIDREGDEWLNKRQTIVRINFNEELD